jgi:glutamate-1-semialdehyde 2,1-aminomutase
MAGLGAFIAAMDFMRRHAVVEHLWSYGRKLLAVMERRAAAHGLSECFKVGGVPCSPYYATLDRAGANSLPLRTLFSQEMIRNGILMPWIALSYRHGDAELTATEHALDRTFAVYRRALEEGVEKYLQGPVIKPVFRKYN